MKEQLDILGADFMTALATVNSAEALKELETEYLGKK